MDCLAIIVSLTSVCGLLDDPTASLPAAQCRGEIDHAHLSLLYSKPVDLGEPVIHCRGGSAAVHANPGSDPPALTGGNRITDGREQHTVITDTELAGRSGVYSESHVDVGVLNVAGILTYFGCPSVRILAVGAFNEESFILP
jgi:hypothetical protein